MKEYLAYEISSRPAAQIKDIAFPDPIILGGCGSSGTTLLKTMFDAHKNIACGQEIAVFDRPLFYQTRVEDLYRMYKNQDFREINPGQIFPMHTKFGSNFGLFIPNQSKAYHNYATIDKIFQMSRDLRHFVNLFFSNWADAQGKKRWAEKTPNNIYCIDRIFEFMPDAKFIHVIRDGRDVALSLVEARDFNTASAVFRWLSAVEAGIRHRGNPRYYEVKYEDLITDTENTLKKLMDFLDEEYDPGMMNYTEKGKKNPLKYGTTPIYTNKIGKWKRTSLDPTFLEIFDLTMKDMLEKLDYEPTTLKSTKSLSLKKV